MIYRTVLFLIILQIVACQSGQKQIKLSSTDSTKTVSPVKAADSDTLLTDSSENMNMSIGQWERFKKKYGLRDDSIHTMFDKNLFRPKRIMGDYNGGKKAEWMAIIPPQKEDSSKGKFQECVGGCNSHIIFSDTTIPILKVENNLGGDIFKIADLDGDGADEILVYPDWWQSNWNSYKVFSYNKKENKWYYLIEPVSIFANDLENKVLVKKAKNKGFLTALTSGSDDEGNVITKYKDFKIVKPSL
jgi:ribosomal protein L31